MDRVVKKLVQSWATTDSDLHSNKEILDWIDQRNRNTHVEISKVCLSDMTDWFYEPTQGILRNQKGTFFQIIGFQSYEAKKLVVEQPIILQNENGYLGIICREIKGILYFLMQAKIEPGNVNKIQLSPTIQATKSNFTQMHGGRKPAYLDYFLYADRYTILLDQLQSEQSARFLKKRNRNMIILVEEEVEELPTHRWMTLGQIKELMCTHDNLVNMDTRTVLSGLPFSLFHLSLEQKEHLSTYFAQKSFFRSIFFGAEDFLLPEVYHALNDYKMFAAHKYCLLPLHKLKTWQMNKNGIFPMDKGGFQVIYCKVEIEGREVNQWTQPMIEATGLSTFALVSCDISGIRYFLVQALAEPGCMDAIELGPSIQIDAAMMHRENMDMKRLLTSPRSQILCDVLLSEEGGRFYHEQNRNILIHTTREEIGELPKGFFLLDYMTLNHMCQINNCLNIQLRNLLSLLRITQ